ncbi:LysR family transcriptional regulator [Pacificimonas sp. WHA3]|uniref:LysR family transcriptional regulator n=1 Tax=Pacificimonas pallii TaxID=2827236 RepID=A0ABS6SBV6_9SPHN|nr:LysR family transcriptional regulator [Pacificimonas pallii]MBV7255907.1 LysR family transcriptional regulator [Pacificimonas pallii]
MSGLSYGHLDFCDLEVLLLVSELGSIRKASRDLGIGQSSVTRRVQKIEDALGVSLFERSTTGVRLTNAGWGFVGNVRTLASNLKAAAETAEAAGIGGNGQLRIGLIASLSRGSLRKIVSGFVNRYPDVEITFTESRRGELMTLLSHRMLDVVFAAGKPPSEHGDMLLTVEEGLYFAVSRHHHLAEKQHVSWAEVEEMEFVVSTEEPGPEIKDYILRKISNLGRQAKIRQHRLDREGIMNLVGLGLGVSLVAEHWCGVRYPNVKFIPIMGNQTAERIPFSLTWRPENDNPALRRFLSLAREHAKAKAVPS